MDALGLQPNFNIAVFLRKALSGIKEVRADLVSGAEILGPNIATVQTCGVIETDRWLPVVQQG